MKIRKKSIQYFKLLLFVFTFLFAPPLIKDLNFVIINFIYALFKILTKHKKKISKFIKNRYIINNAKIICLYIFFYIFSIITNVLLSGEVYFENYFINFYSIVLAFPVVWICSVYVIFEAEELEMKSDDIIKIIIQAGIIQGIICILSLLLPSFKSYLVSIMYANTGDKLLNTPWITSRRFYGFANNMLDLYGFGTGILCVLPLYMILKGKKNYIFSLIFLLPIPLLNSRSGLVIFIAGVIILMLYSFNKDKNKARKFFVLFFIMTILFILAFNVINIYSPNTIDWILNDVKSFFSDDDTTVGTADALFSEGYWELPSLEHIIIGTGYSVSAYSDYALEGITHSDVGYINEIWKVGIVGSMILYSSFINILKSGYRSIKDKFYKTIFIVFGISIFIFLVKATVYTYNTGTAIIYMFTLYSIYNSKRVEEEKNDICNNTGI